MLHYSSEKPMEIFTKNFGISDEFSKHYQYVHTIFSWKVFFFNQHTEISSLAPVANSEVQDAINRQLPSKSVGLDDIHIFACIRVLSFVFNIITSRNSFPNLWK
jgi:hypothetical protein